MSEDFKPEPCSWTEQERQTYRNEMVARYEYGDWKRPKIFLEELELYSLYFGDH